jgi:hypothetical protein
VSRAPPARADEFRRASVPRRTSEFAEKNGVARPRLGVNSALDICRNSAVFQRTGTCAQSVGGADPDNSRHFRPHFLAPKAKGPRGRQRCAAVAPDGGRMAGQQAVDMPFSTASFRATDGPANPCSFRGAESCQRSESRADRQRVTDAWAAPRHPVMARLMVALQCATRTACASSRRRARSSAPRRPR